MSGIRTKPETSRESVIGHASGILRVLRSPVAVESKTMDLIELADKHGALASCSPIGGAAGVVYISGILTENPVTLARIAEVAEISPETVRRYKTLLVTQLKIKKR